jgi:superfamily II DNA/RNA helicase
MRFQYLGLSSGLLRAIADAGYEKPTPIQWQAIPAVLQGKDVLGIAQTGTGKTASFVLPMLDKLGKGQAKARMPRSLILEPTRELAAQVADNFVKYGKNHKLSMALLIGGVSMPNQVKELNKSVDVLIATPGRLLDHFGRGNVMLSGIQTLVIDEADRMLDMGFIPDVEEICSKIVQGHQTLFFSATMPPPIKKLSDRFLNDPKVVEVARQATTAETITQIIRHVPPRQKREVLRDILAGDEVQNAIVFCNRKVEVKEVYKSMKRHGLNTAQLHGDMVQSERMEVLQDFKDGKIKVLVASDVAARGLDIPNVSHIINFDVPHQAEDYVHRIGRTGRAGRSGTAVTLCSKAEQKYVDDIERLIKVKLQLDGTRSASADAPEKTDQQQKPQHPERGKQPETAEQNERTKSRLKRGRGRNRNRSGEQNKPRADESKPAADKNKNRPENKDFDGKPKANNKPKKAFGDHMPAFMRTGNGK